MNFILLVGRLGKLPEYRILPNGTGVATLSIATSDGFGEDKKTNWHRAVCFGSLAEKAKEHLDKGTQVSVTGKIQTRTYKNKQNVEQSMTEVLVDKLDII